ncbi:MAG: hypothetical protein K2J70_03750 [Muribaculaceae bacterium]|nr:hypothetical protein [Muribaculaceae bacterium]
MREIKIGSVNGIAITAYRKEDGFFVPIRPICDALGIDVEPQRRKLNEDYLVGATTVIMTAVGADGRTREMFCLPLKFVCGWIFSINPGKVAQEARENVEKYRAECYDVLYRHFFGGFIADEQNAAKAGKLKKEIEDVKQEQKQLEDRRKELNRKAAELSKEYDDLTFKIICSSNNLSDI